MKLYSISEMILLLKSDLDELHDEVNHGLDVLLFGQLVMSSHDLGELSEEKS
jgi:hypothetical protein